MEIAAIVAMDRKRVIGKDNRLPWRLPEDMRHFADLTTGHTVLMGRKTFESLPPKFRPLPNRKNIVVSRGGFTAEGVEVWDSLDKCIESYRSGASQGQGSVLWIIGGATIYEAALSVCDRIELTLVEGEHEGDAFFPVFEDKFEVVRTEGHEGYSFLTYGARASRPLK